MAEESAAEKSERIAIEVQTKYEFWLLGLIFAVLALAVQTAPFDGPRLARACELLAWIDLLLAGLIGISRLEWTAPLYKLMSHQQRMRKTLQTLKETEDQGTKVYVAEPSGNRPVDVRRELIAPREATLEAVEARLEKAREEQVRKYRLIRVLLILGFALLLIARGYSPAVELFTDP